MAGDKVSLRVVKVSLVEGSSLFLVTKKFKNKFLKNKLVVLTLQQGDSSVLYPS